MEISNSGPKSYETATVMKMPASFAEFSDALQKARIKDGNLKLGFRGDLKFQQNPEVIEVAPLVETAQTQFLDISFLM